MNWFVGILLFIAVFLFLSFLNSIDDNLRDISKALKAIDYHMDIIKEEIKLISKSVCNKE